DVPDVVGRVVVADLAVRPLLALDADVGARLDRHGGRDVRVPPVVARYRLVPHGLALVDAEHDLRHGFSFHSVHSDAAESAVRRWGLGLARRARARGPLRGTRAMPATASPRASPAESSHQPPMSRRPGPPVVSPYTAERTATARPRSSMPSAMRGKKANHSRAHSSHMPVQARSPTTVQECTAKTRAPTVTVSENQPRPWLGQPVMPLMPTHR